MRDRNWLPMVMALLLVSTGCATQREWGGWRAHSTHFATDDLLGFSLSNGAAGRVHHRARGRPAGRDLPLPAVAGPDRDDAGPLSRTAPPHGGVGWTTMVRMTAR